MEEREKIIKLWFDMWLQQRDLGIDNIFEEKCNLHRKLES